MAQEILSRMKFLVATCRLSTPNPNHVESQCKTRLESSLNFQIHLVQMWLDLRWNMTFNIVCLQTTRRDALCIVFASYHAGSMFRLMRCKQVVGTGQLGKTGIDLHGWHSLDTWVLSETNKKNDIEVCVKIHKKKSYLWNFVAFQGFNPILCNSFHHIFRPHRLGGFSDKRSLFEVMKKSCFVRRAWEIAVPLGPRHDVRHRVDDSPEAFGFVIFKGRTFLNELLG